MRVEGLHRPTGNWTAPFKRCQCIIIKNYFKNPQVLKKRYQNGYYHLCSVHLADHNLQNRYKSVVEFNANLSGFISSISAENIEKRRHISNITLLILFISRYFHFLCSHWGHLWWPLLWASVANLGLWGISWGQEGSALKTLNPYSTPQTMVLPIWE